MISAAHPLSYLCWLCNSASLLLIKVRRQYHVSITWWKLRHNKSWDIVSFAIFYRLAVWLLLIHIGLFNCSLSVLCSFLEPFWWTTKLLTLQKQIYWRFIQIIWIVLFVEGSSLDWVPTASNLIKGSELRWRFWSICSFLHRTFL